MITFSPELQIQVAKVISNEGGSLRLEKQERPNDVDYGGGFEERAEKVIITLIPSDIASGSYKVVQQ
jgi:hypothetical protein